MVPLSAGVVEELDLIEAVTMLSQYDLPLLPLQIRLKLHAVDQLFAQLLQINPK